LSDGRWPPLREECQTLKVQVNTDNQIEGREALVAEVEATVESALRHFTSHITRVEVHLADVNSGKGGIDDKRCVMEARLQGRQPVAVTHHAATLSMAMNGAAAKLKAALGTTLGRAGNVRPGRDDTAPQSPDEPDTA